MSIKPEIGQNPDPQQEDDFGIVIGETIESEEQGRETKTYKASEFLIEENGWTSINRNPFIIRRSKAGLTNHDHYGHFLDLHSGKPGTADNIANTIYSPIFTGLHYSDLYPLALQIRGEKTTATFNTLYENFLKDRFFANDPIKDIRMCLTYAQEKSGQPTEEKSFNENQFRTTEGYYDLLNELEAQTISNNARHLNELNAQGGEALVLQESLNRYTELYQIIIGLGRNYFDSAKILAMIDERKNALMETYKDTPESKLVEDFYNSTSQISEYTFARHKERRLRQDKIISSSE
jgi:hypothetical protein